MQAACADHPNNKAPEDIRSSGADLFCLRYINRHRSAFDFRSAARNPLCGACLHMAAYRWSAYTTSGQGDIKHFARHSIHHDDKGTLRVSEVQAPQPLPIGGLQQVGFMRVI